jgi:hypothetical protein
MEECDFGFVLKSGVGPSSSHTFRSVAPQENALEKSFERNKFLKALLE